MKNQLLPFGRKTQFSQECFFRQKQFIQYLNIYRSSDEHIPVSFQGLPCPRPRPRLCRLRLPPPGPPFLTPKAPRASPLTASSTSVGVRAVYRVFLLTPPIKSPIVLWPAPLKSFSSWPIFLSFLSLKRFASFFLLPGVGVDKAIDTTANMIIYWIEEIQPLNLVRLELNCKFPKWPTIITRNRKNVIAESIGFIQQQESQLSNDWIKPIHKYLYAWRYVPRALIM